MYLRLESFAIHLQLSATHHAGERSAVCFLDVVLRSDVSRFVTTPVICGMLCLRRLEINLQVSPWIDDNTATRRFIAEEVGKVCQSFTRHCFEDWSRVHAARSGDPAHPQEWAEWIVKDIEGVESVDNQIEVLPLSPNGGPYTRRFHRSTFS